VSKSINKILSSLVRAERSPVVSILCFHRVLTEPDYLRPGDPTSLVFEKVISGLRRFFDVINLSDIPDYLRSAGMGHGLVVSFDDGYEDNYSQAAPILRRLSVPATFFVATGTLNRGCMWNDLVIESVRALSAGPFHWDKVEIEAMIIESDAERVLLARRVLSQLKFQPPSLRSDLAEEFAQMSGLSERPEMMMTHDEVAELDKNPLFDIGAHTVLHPILAAVPRDSARREIAEGKMELEAILGRDISLFAYPNGIPGKDFDLDHVRMISELGFEIAVTTSTGGVRKTSFPLLWPRQSIWQDSSLRALSAILRDCRSHGDMLD